MHPLPPRTSIQQAPSSPMYVYTTGTLYPHMSLNNTHPLPPHTSIQHTLSTPTYIYTTWTLYPHESKQHTPSTYTCIYTTHTLYPHIHLYNTHPLPPHIDIYTVYSLCCWRSAHAELLCKWDIREGANQEVEMEGGRKGQSVLQIHFTTNIYLLLNIRSGCIGGLHVCLALPNKSHLVE